MSKFLLILCLSAFGLSLKATECHDKVFMEEYVNLYLCQNLSNYNDTRALLFKARTKVLNEYIREKIKSGQLQDKKFEIQIYDAILSIPHIDISQGKNGYFVSYSGFPTIHELKAFVNYYANKSQMSFYSGDYQKLSQEVIYERINGFFKDNMTSETILPQMTVWEDDNLSIEYVNDTLWHFINSTSLDIEAASPLPVKIKDRFLLFQDDSIFVLQGCEIIKSIKISPPPWGDCIFYVYDKWANICYGRPDNWIYSYSYDKNYFYKRKDKD